MLSLEYGKTVRACFIFKAAVWINCKAIDFVK